MVTKEAGSKANSSEVSERMRRMVEGGNPRLVAELCIQKDCSENDLVHGLSFLIRKGEEGDNKAWGALKAVVLLREEFDYGKQCRFIGYDVFDVPKEYLATNALIAAGGKASDGGQGKFIETFRQIVSAEYPEELVGESWLLPYKGKSMEYFFNIMFGLAAENEWYGLIGTMVNESRDAGMAVPALNAAVDGIKNAILKAVENGDIVAKSKLEPMHFALVGEAIAATEHEIKGIQEYIYSVGRKSV
ncbi:MAG: hypothetical protein PHF51_05490 [Candidatus ainarchaeum sp.]|nr:hypothetical protein [Candidatus ainarchaeum sp.]